MTADVIYRIGASRPEAHLFDVELTIVNPSADGQRLTLPNWIPGSYMIWEFARHIVRIEARDGRGIAGLRVDVFLAPVGRGGAGGKSRMPSAGGRDLSRHGVQAEAAACGDAGAAHHLGFFGVEILRHSRRAQGPGELAGDR